MNPLSSRRTGLTVAVLLLATACESRTGGRPAERVEITDSGAVRIVTHPEGAWTDTVADTPVLTIGREGEPNYELYRVSTVLGLASGNVVVVNGGTSELRFYDPAGEFIRGVGRQGDGPSEFGFVGGATVRPGDTIVAVDPRHRRVLMFDSAGSFVRGESYADVLNIEIPRLSGQPVCRGPAYHGQLATGLWVISDWTCLSLKGTSGRRAWGVRYMLAGDSERDTLFSTEGPYVWERGGVSDPRDQYVFFPLAGLPRVHETGNRVFISEGNAYEISVFDSTGALSQKWREDAMPPEITSAVREAYIAALEAADRSHPEDVPFPNRTGSYSQLIVAHGGSVWLQRIPLPGEAYERWVVFSSDGTALRRLVLPEFTLASVRNGRAYGYETDSLGIQKAVVYDVGMASTP